MPNLNMIIIDASLSTIGHVSATWKLQIISLVIQHLKLIHFCFSESNIRSYGNFKFMFKYLNYPFFILSVTLFADNFFKSKYLTW